MTGCFKNDKRNLVNFTEVVESLKRNFNSLFFRKYTFLDLEIYRGVSPHGRVMQNSERITLTRERIIRSKHTNNFQSLASFWDNDYFDYFYFFQKIQQKMDPKLKKATEK